MSPSRHLIAVGLVFLAVAPAAAATFDELVGWCAPPDAGGRDRLCWGYLETYLEGLASTDPMVNRGFRICVPGTEDRGKLVRLLRTYASENPSSHGLAGIDGVGRALEGRYPCR